VALGKEGFADQFFAVCSLSSAALGKGFVECNLAFAECLSKEPESSSVKLVTQHSFVPCLPPLYQGSNYESKKEGAQTTSVDP
jgi:hypothetical protein